MTDATSQAAQGTTQAAGGDSKDGAGKTTVTGGDAKTGATGTVQQQQAQGSNDGTQGDGKGGNAQAKPGAPEKYEFKAPEGVTLDTGLVNDFTPLAKELGMSQDAAQKVVDLYASKVLPRLATAQQE